MLNRITEYYSGTVLYASHLKDREISDQEWVSVCGEVNERYRPIHDQRQAALKDAEEYTREHHFTPSDVEWEDTIEEYCLDHGIRLPTLREVIIAVLEEKALPGFRKGGRAITRRPKQYEERVGIPKKLGQNPSGKVVLVYRVGSVLPVPSGGCARTVKPRTFLFQDFWKTIIRKKERAGLLSGCSS